MRCWFACLFSVFLFCSALTGLRPGFAEGEKSGTAAIARGLAFLEKDAADWKTTKKCATCHHGTMTLWAFSEARRQGYAVEARLVTETREWTRERLAGIEKPRDPRPGWNMINTPALYLAAMTQVKPGLEILTPEELRAVAGHVDRHLEADGSVLTPATMSPPLPRNGPPPIFESREVLTLLAVLALLPQEPTDPKAASPLRDTRKKAEGWLDAQPDGEDLQSASLRLLVAAQEKKPSRTVRAATDSLLALQNSDGGWGQLSSLPSDAYATGLALYTLSVTGIDRRRAEVRRGVAFLAASQKADGSWPIQPRAHPGAQPTHNTAPIGHYAACWALLGLVRSVAR